MEGSADNYDVRSLLDILDSLDAIIYVADMKTYEVLYINKFTRDIFGNIVGKKCWKSLQQGQSGPCPFCSNDKLLDKTGKPTGTYVWEFQNTVNNAWYEVRDKAISWHDGRLVRLEIATDISQRKKTDIVLEESEKKLKTQNKFLENVIESMPYPFLVIDAKSYQIITANWQVGPVKAWEGKTCHEVTHHNDFPCEDKAHFCPLNEVKKSKKAAVVEHTHFDIHGNARYFEVHGYPIMDSSGNVVQMIEYSVDITGRKLLEKKLESISITDDLTGILNRRGFLTIGAQQIKNAKRSNKGVCLLYVDLDNMKEINDQHGHKTGDQALLETASVLRETFRESDVVGRLGGDEFAVLIMGENEKDCRMYEIMIDRLDDKLKTLNRQEGRLYELHMSTGIAKCDLNSNASVDELLAIADKAMYEDKRRKKRL